MSAPRGLWRRLRLYASMVRYGYAHHRDFAAEHHAFFLQLRRDLERIRGPLAGCRVLEVGCGKMMWLTLLLHGCGARVTGIDTEWTEPGLGLGKIWRLLRTNGIERTARTLAWDALYARSYYRALERVSGSRLHFDGVDARRMSATELDFADHTFDVVVSHEVFEHLPDVDGAARELHRVMKPDGVTYLYVHNYASISGGHHIAWKYPDREPSTVVPPWDHLRHNLAPDIPSWINRWREAQYREVFERRFEILDWIAGAREGTALLTPEIRRELADYSQTELLTKGFVIVARPRHTPSRAADGPA